MVSGNYNMPGGIVIPHHRLVTAVANCGGWRWV